APRREPPRRLAPRRRAPPPLSRLARRREAPLPLAPGRRRGPRPPPRPLRLRAHPPRGRPGSRHARRRAPPPRARPRPARRRPPRDPRPGPHARQRGAALPRDVPLLGRPPLGRRRAPRRGPRRLLVLVGRADPVHGAAARPSLRVGAAGPRR